jgi:hypothetical protein
MQDMSREVIEMTEQMARTDVALEQRKDIARQMEDMSEIAGWHVEDPAPSVESSQGGK